MTNRVSNAELSAWDSYFAAAITTVSTPGTLGSVVENDVKAAVRKAAVIADLMIEARRLREPK